MGKEWLNTEIYLLQYNELPSFVALTTNMSALKSPESSKVSEDEDVGVLNFFWNSAVPDLGALKK